MNTRQLQYAALLSRVRSFSQAAESLGISQPALSKQIIALEEELGVKLFDRSTSPLTVTAAGEHFAQQAEQLLYREDQLLRAMAQYRTGETGRLVVGVSPFRSLYMMPPFVRALKAHFPGLQIVLHEANSAQLLKGVTEGHFDFAIMNLPVDESVLDVIPLKQDELVLAVPEMLLESIPELPEEGGAIDLAACSALPFIALSQQQELRQQFGRLCALAGLEPDIQVEVVGIATAWEMVRCGVGAAVLPRQFVQKDGHPGVRLLPLVQQAAMRQPAIITRRGQFISRFAEYAMSLLKGM